MTLEIFRHRRHKEATAYITFSLAKEMKFTQSVHALIHPSPHPQALNVLQSHLRKD